MKNATLYIFIGAPGAGKTTVAQRIAELTGAKHIWADAERHRLFPNPTHAPEESAELYDKLNAATDYLLRQGRSVVFDTNFNYLADRQKLRDIASSNKAKTVVIWLTTPLETARKRALHSEVLRNGYDYHMSAQQFDDIVQKLEPPTKDEKIIKIDGSELDVTALKQHLGL